MKRILALVCVVFFVASSPSVYAASDELPDDVFNQVEYQELCDICEKEFEYLDGEYSRDTLAGGYRYYLMDPGVFECLIDSEVPLIHLVSGSMPYAWVILGGNDTIFDFRYSELEDDWILVGET